jgi:PmbA protein
MSDPRELLSICQDAVGRAQRLGADQAEVFASAQRSAQVDLQKDDIHTACTEEETTFGVRVFKAGSLGFSTVNGREHLDEACREALALANASPADPGNALAEPAEVPAFERRPDPQLEALDVAALVEHAVQLLARIRERDARVRVDSGSVSAQRSARAIASSAGVALCGESASASADVFGMAVDGSDVGSFDVESAAVLRAAELGSEVAAMAERFVEKCTGALGARKAESFRGSVVLSPEVVASFVLGNLFGVLSGKAVRTGRSPLAQRVGQKVADACFTLTEDGRLPEGIGSGAFDREGSPTRRNLLIDAGVLRGFLYDVYEARAAGAAPTGNARGGAASLPMIAPCNVLLEPGATPYAALCREPERAVLVNRFSGSSNPITGEFSGVVKGGFLLRAGERIPIRETMIAGNLYDLLGAISGVSKEIQKLRGSAFVPALRVENISITAG